MASPGKKAFLLRLDPGVWEELERLAAAELRSVNGQIEMMLRESLARRGGSAGTARGRGRTPAADAPDADLREE